MLEGRGRQVGGSLLVAVPLVVVFAVLPAVYSNGLLLFNFVMFLTLAQGLNVIYGFTGFLPFGYVGFFGAGAYGFAIAVMHLGAPPVTALAVAGGAAVLLGCILAPLMRLTGAYFAISNLAAAQAVYQVISNPDLQSITKGPYGVSLSGVFAPGCVLLCRCRSAGGDAGGSDLAAQLPVRAFVAGAA